MIKNGYKFNDHQLTWLDALRSGNYKQGKGALWEIPNDDPNEEKHFCCLGVAMDLFDKDDESMVRGSSMDISSSKGGLVSEVVNKKLDLIENGGEFTDGYGVEYITEYKNKGTVNCLTALNDFAHYTFEEIADFIEENPTKVFASNTIQAK